MQERSITERSQHNVIGALIQACVSCLDREDTGYDSQKGLPYWDWVLGDEVRLVLTEKRDKENTI